MDRYIGLRVNAMCINCAKQALMLCLESKEYMEVRNAFHNIYMYIYIYIYIYVYIYIYIYIYIYMCVCVYI